MRCRAGKSKPCARGARSWPKPTSTCAAGEAFLIGAHLSPLRSTSTHVTADPVRTRKLLLRRSELQSLIGSVERRGYTLVPLELYWKAGRAKLTVGLAKGKKQHDKRAVEKDRDWQRNKARILRGR